MTRHFGFLILLCGLAFWSACTKSLDAPLPTQVKGTRDTAGNIRTILRNGPCTLFYQAYIRANLDSPYAYYTVFVPSDSAMTAAGLTSQVIAGLSLDSLYTLIGYHIVPGRVPETALGNDTLTPQLPTMVETTGQAYNTYYQLGPATLQAYLYVSEKDVLYVDGVPSNKGEAPQEASNGWVYPVNHVLLPPSQTVWGIIRSRPELSMYLEANLLVDSMDYANAFSYALVDSNLFNTVPYIPLNNYGQPFVTNLVTVLAPTNDAFVKAGFTSMDVLRQYITQSVPSNYALVTWPGYPNPGTLPAYNAMDSVLKLHYLCNPGQGIAFYQDLLYSPAVNDGWMNTNPFEKYAYQMAASTFPGVAPVYEQFSNKGGVLQVQWSPNVPAAAIPFPASGDFMGNNGVVYEVDQLFYPHN